MKESRILKGLRMLHSKVSGGNSPAILERKPGCNTASCSGEKNLHLNQRPGPLEILLLPLVLECFLPKGQSSGNNIYQPNLPPVPFHRWGPMGAFKKYCFCLVDGKVDTYGIETILPSFFLPWS